MLTKNEIVDLYRKRAKRYDLASNLYYVFGFRQWLYRERTVKALNLNIGDTVIEIGCGTGLNFSLLRQAVGSAGKIIGVDLTDNMLDQAQKRIDRNGWSNVELVAGDISSYNFPQGVDGIISTFAITFVPDYDSIIQKTSKALSLGKRIAIMDFKQPSWQPLWIVKIAVFLTRLFGVSLDLADRHPWESIERYFIHSWFKDVYMGFTYIAVGEKG